MDAINWRRTSELKLVANIENCTATSRRVRVSGPAFRKNRPASLHGRRFVSERPAFVGPDTALGRRWR